MKLSTLSIAAVVSLVALVGCNGSDPKQDCRDSAKTSCEKMWTCDNVTFKIGDDQADCENDSAALCIAAVEVRDGEPCPEGQTYDSDAARACADGIGSQTCEQFTSGTKPEACNRICTAG